MPGNNRLYYAIESISFASEGSPGSGYINAHGVQSVGMTTNFNPEQVSELGQLEVYTILENVPQVELNVEKCIDGYPLIYHLGSQSATARTLANRTTLKTDVIMSMFSDLGTAASGVPLTQVYTSGMFISSLNYALPVQGYSKETIGFVGNDKLWLTSGFYFNGQFTGSDSPASGIQRRQNVIMGAAPTGSVFPKQIQGLTTVTGSGYNILTGGNFGAHIQDVSISCNLGREDLLELGRFKPYYKYAKFPIPVDTTINVIAAGATPGDLVNASSNGGNLVDEPIMIKLSDGTLFDLGSKNKCQSITFNGGDTGGTPLTMTYSYQNYNHLDITSSSDPAGQV